MTTPPRQATETPAGEPAAWALDLAETIFRDTCSHSRLDALRLIACRLHLVREQGIGAGLEQAREAIRS